MTKYPNDPLDEDTMHGLDMRELYRWKTQRFLLGVLLAGGAMVLVHFLRHWWRS